MQLTISRMQKACIFVGAAFCGSLCMAGILWDRLKGESARTLANSHFTYFLGGGFALICYVVFAVVFGAWLGGVCCLVWKSPPGKRWFWTLSGGTWGGAIAVAFVLQWLLRLQWPASRGHVIQYLMISGSAILTLTLLGLVIGSLIGRRAERFAMGALTSTIQE